MLRARDVPVFRADLRLSVIQRDFAYLVGEEDSFSLSGETMVTVAALIDGERSVAHIVQQHDHPEGDIPSIEAIDRLVDRGLVVPRQPEMPAAEAAFWQSVLGAGYSNMVAARQSRALPDVEVVSIDCDVARSALTRSLSQHGLKMSTDADHVVVLASDYLALEPSRVGRSSPCPTGRWLLAKPTGVRLWVGPFLGAQDGPCLECLLFWLRTNRPVETLLRRERGASEGRQVAAPAAIEGSVEIACHLVAVAAVRALMSATGKDALDDRLLELDLSTFETSTHRVTRRPQCPRCGDSNLMARKGFASIRPAPVPKSSVEDGGYRVVAPRETFERYQHLISRVTGAVTHVTRMPDRDTPTRSVYSSAHRVVPWDASLRHQRLRRDCAGKGRNPEQARASALCEALERYSAVYQGDEAKVRGCYRGLAPRAVHPDDLQHFSAAQRQRSQAAGRLEPHRWVGEAVNEDTEFDWTPAWSLTRDQSRLVPLAYCFSETPAGPEMGFCRYNPNGAAAGNCIEEAILHGLFELVERDAVAVWWYNRIARPEIDLSRIGDTYFATLKADYASLGWKLWALDLTHDLGIPVCVALAQHERGDRFCIGFGCHLSFPIAVQRAVTELNQLFAPESSRLAPWDIARMDSRTFLFPDPNALQVPPRAHLAEDGAHLGAAIERLVTALASRGLELLVVDKTRPDIGLPVVHVIVPGLRHFWPRLGLGRLFTVPCELGWLSHPLAEAELNPVPLFL